MLHQSYGIICFGQASNKDLCVLLVRKRHTNSYVRFLLGNYSGLRSLQRLIRGMTVEEHLDMMHCNFDTIWRRTFSSRYTNSKKYLLSKANYACKFGSYNRRDLHRFISKSNACCLPREIPKGKRDETESPLDAAKREFEEETGFKTSAIDIMPDIFVEGQNIEHNTYIMMFFIGWFKHTVRPGLVRNSNTDHKLEIDGAEWVRVTDIEQHNIDTIYIRYINEAINLIPEHIRPIRNSIQHQSWKRASYQVKS